MNAVTIGVLGQQWRAMVTPWGGLEMWDDLGVVDWFVAADDRWHVPAQEPTVRQRTFDGTPVVETRVRIPNGDAVQRVYAVADHGGLTVIEVENDSPLPIAVAFTGAALCSARPPTDVPIRGLDLSVPAVSFPVGHHATLSVAVPHGPGAPSVLPSGLPSAAQVSRGWLTLCERASRLLLPDASLGESVVRERCELLLCGPDEAGSDPVGFLLAVGDLVRMGSRADDWMPEVAEAIALLGGHLDDPMLVAGLDAAGRVCRAAGDQRAQRDLGRVRARLLDDASRTTPRRPDGNRLEGSGVRRIVATEQSIVNGSTLFPAGLPSSWLGQQLEIYGVPTGPDSAVSFALRWHGARPAILWEQTGAPIELSAPTLAPGWSTGETTGEALWPAPAGSEAERPMEWADTADASAIEPPSAHSDGDVSFG